MSDLTWACIFALRPAAMATACEDVKVNQLIRKKLLKTLAVVYKSVMVADSKDNPGAHPVDYTPLFCKATTQPWAQLALQMYGITWNRRNSAPHECLPGFFFILKACPPVRGALVCWVRLPSMVSDYSRSSIIENPHDYSKVLPPSQACRAFPQYDRNGVPEFGVRAMIKHIAKPNSAMPMRCMYDFYRLMSSDGNSDGMGLQVQPIGIERDVSITKSEIYANMIILGRIGVPDLREWHYQDEDCRVWKSVCFDKKNTVDKELYESFRCRVNASPIWDRETRRKNDDNWSKRVRSLTSRDSVCS